VACGFLGRNAQLGFIGVLWAMGGLTSQKVILQR
jgi:hypothetical protein